MTRQTSIEAYNAIKENGLLSHRRFQVYDYVFHNGPVTARQAWKAIDPNVATGSIVTRFSELERMGILTQVGEIVDQSTGMSAILWDVTEKLPMKINKKKKKETFMICKTHRMLLPDDMVKCSVNDLFPCWVITVCEK